MSPANGTSVVHQGRKDDHKAVSTGTIYTGSTAS